MEAILCLLSCLVRAPGVRYYSPTLIEHKPFSPPTLPLTPPCRRPPPHAPFFFSV